MNGDGLKDIISGSYVGAPPRDENGKRKVYKDAEGNTQSEIFVFYQRADGTFGPRQRLTFCHLHSTADPVDWDGDGDYDLVVSGHRKHGIILMKNNGSRTEPKFNETMPLIPELDEKALRNLSITSAEAVDWDGDDLLDIVAGSNWGQIFWFRNIGSADEAAFNAEPQYLVGGDIAGGDIDAKRKFLDSNPWGARVVLCVVDWDGDGILDVLMGDNHYQDVTKERLSAEDLVAFEAAMATIKEYSKRTQALYPKDKTYKELSKEEIAAIRAESNKIRQEYSEEFATISKLRVVERHGYIWLFRGVK